MTSFKHKDVPNFDKDAKASGQSDNTANRSLVLHAAHLRSVPSMPFVSQPCQE